jgi:hypothetical protein
LTSVTPLAHRLDHARALHAQRAGQRLRIQAGAEVDVDEVDADRFMPHLRLARSRRPEVDVHQFHHFRSADAVHAYCLGHFHLH